MATTSFDKNFVVNNTKSIEQLQKSSSNPRIVSVRHRNYKEENKRGIALILQQLSNSKNY